jgi:hypothetical protein
MVLTVSTSYDSGTVDTASGTTITLASGTAVAGWVGRLFVLNRSISDRGGQWRKITAVNSSTSITIEYAWRTTLDSSDPDYETLPQNGDAFHISHTWDDIDDSTNITKLDDLLYENTSGLTLSGNVTLFDENVSINLDAPTISTSKAVTVGATAGLILGNYNSQQQPEQGCFLYFNYPSVSSVLNIFGTSSSNATGDVIFNGCIIRTNSPASMGPNVGPVMRLNRGSDSRCRLVGCRMDGVLAWRITGDRAVVRDVSQTSTLGSFSPFRIDAPVGLLEGNEVFNSEQAVSWYFLSSGSAVIRALKARNISENFARVLTFNSGSTVNTIDFVDADYDFSAPVFIALDAGINQTITNKKGFWRFSLEVKAEFNGSASGGGRFYLSNAQSEEFYNDVSSDGSYPTQNLILREYDLNTTVIGVINIDFDDASRSTLRAPYTGSFREYGYQFLDQTFSAIEPQIFTWFKQVNSSLTAVDASTALAVTNPTTANEIYDHSQATYAESGNIQYAEKITTNDGVTLTFDLDVTLNASATSETYDFANDAVEYANVTNGTFSTLTLGANRTLTLGNYSAYASSDWSIPATATINVDACPSTVDLSNWTFANGATFEITDGGSVTITVASSSLASQLDADKVETSGSITFSAPTLTVTIPVESGSRIYIYEADTTTVNASTDSSGTSFAWTQGTPGDDYDIYIIKPGTESQRILAYTYPSASATLTVQQPTDDNYSATSSLDIDDTASGTAIGSTADFWLDPDNGAFYLDTGVNLSQPTGITGQQLYSLFVEARFSSTRAGVIQAHRGIFAVDIDAGKLILNGLAFGDNTTRDLIRSVGVAQFDEVGGTIEAEWMGIICRGSLASTSTAYYWQVDTTNPTITNCINTGLPNQLIPIYGDASNGNFDYRDFFKISVRKQGETPSTYDLVDSGEITTLPPRSYEIFLTTTANPNLTVADTSIDANSDGTADVAPYDGMNITWLTSAAVDDWADATEYDPFDYVESGGSFYITVEGGTSSGTGVADDTGVTWYEIDRIYDANGGDLSQMTNYLFWAQRQTVDIDAGTGTQKGSTVDSLATTRGSDLVLAPGLWAINFAASAQNHHFPTEVDGSEYEYPAPPPTITVLGFQPLSDVKIIYAGQTLSILNQTSPPFTYNVGDLLLPVTVTLTITKAGFETYTQGVAIVDSDVSITVAQIPEDSSDTYNSPQVEFQTLMMGDSGFLRVLAGATEALADEVAAVRLANFSESSVKAAWALLVDETVPTSEEITTWQGYLTSTGYSNISFNSETGEVD